MIVVGIGVGDLVLHVSTGEVGLVLRRVVKKSRNLNYRMVPTLEYVCLINDQHVTLNASEIKKVS